MTQVDTKKLREMAAEHKLSPSPAGVLQVAVANGFFTRFERIGSITEMCDELDDARERIAQLERHDAIKQKAFDALTEERDRLRGALKHISTLAPTTDRHPMADAYDFGSQYFNTSDDYAVYREDQMVAGIGDIARAALGEGK